MTSLRHSYSTIDMYKKCPYNYYRQKIVKDIKKTYTKQKDDGISSHKSIEDRLLVGTPLPEKLNNLEKTCKTIETYGDELFVEKIISLDVNLDLCDDWDYNRWLTSILDVLVIDNNKAYVIDWKTGNYWKDNLQMLIAAHNILHTMPKVDTVLTSVRWLKTGQENKQNFKRSQARIITTEIRAMVGKIDDSIDADEWPCKKSGLCPYCPTKKDCPLFKK